MEFSTLISGIIIILLITVPIGLLIRSGNKRRQKMEKLITELAKKYELNFDLHEIWNDKALAIDPQNKWIAFAEKTEQLATEQLIDLSKIRMCNIRTQTLPRKGEVPIVSRVELQFLHKHEPGHQENMVIYDVDRDEAIAGGYHHEIAKRWHERIKNHIK